MRPRILISGCDESRFLYEDAVTQSGGIPQSYYCPDLDGSCDALLLCGGNDVAPWHYGQENIACQELDEKRDRAEIALARLYIEAGKPVLGICRGMQLLNVVLGGSLQQDIGQALHPFHCHDNASPDRTHPICTREGSRIHSLFGSRLVVNTLHHQAVDRIGRGLIATAWSESGLIEAVEHESLPVFGVQWHPERMSFTRRRPDAADAAPIFSWFIQAAGGEKR